MISIVPAVLATSEEDFSRDFRKIDESGLFTGGIVQIDFADGQFVPNKTISVDTIKKYSTGLKREAHLMVKNPADYFSLLSEVGFFRVIFHLEVGHTSELIDKARKINLEVGIAINPETNVFDTEGFIESINVLQIMSIHPGFQGQEFLPQSLKRIKDASRMKTKNDKLIVEVDGGINNTNIQSIIDAGADNLVIGSYLLKGNIDENLEKIWEEIKS